MKQRAEQKGFTMVEMVVSLAVFLVISGVVVNIFLSIIAHQKRILNEQELLNQVSFAGERVSRSLRMAAKAEDTSCLAATGRYYELTHCPGGSMPCNGVKFISQSDGNICQEYYMDTTDPSNPIFKEKRGVASPQNLLSTKLHVNYVRFILDGNKGVTTLSSIDPVQPKISFMLDIKSPDNQEKLIQSTVSRRDLNIAN